MTYQESPSMIMFAYFEEGAEAGGGDGDFAGIDGHGR
jgi:hypothetical protein